jgi:hypothetical protein
MLNLRQEVNGRAVIACAAHSSFHADKGWRVSHAHTTPSMRPIGPCHQVEHWYDDTRCTWVAVLSRVVVWGKLQHRSQLREGTSTVLEPGVLGGMAGMPWRRRRAAHCEQGGKLFKASGQVWVEHRRSGRTSTMNQPTPNDNG